MESRCTLKLQRLSAHPNEWDVKTAGSEKSSGGCFHDEKPLGGAAITVEQIENLVKASGLTGESSTISGGDNISVLYNKSVTVTIVDVNGNKYSYTVKFAAQ